MPTIDVQVSSNSDDSIQSVVGNNDDKDNDDRYYLATPGGGGIYAFAGMRFLAITIPAGAVIGANSYISVMRGTSPTYQDPDLDIYFEKSATPATFSNQVNGISGLTRTTAVVTWTTTGLPPSAFANSPSIAAVLQELVNAYTSYSSGAMKAILVARSTSRVQLDGYLQAAGSAAKLHIEYNVGGAGILRPANLSGNFQDLTMMS